MLHPPQHRHKRSAAVSIDLNDRHPPSVPSSPKRSPSIDLDLINSPLVHRTIDLKLKESSESLNSFKNSNKIQNISNNPSNNSPFNFKSIDYDTDSDSNSNNNNDDNNNTTIKDIQDIPKSSNNIQSQNDIQSTQSSPKQDTQDTQPSKETQDIPTKPTNNKKTFIKSFIRWLKNVI